MNIYFIFEGKTEQIVYEHWFKTLLPKHTEVIDIEGITQNNYYKVSNMGQPDCYNSVAAAFQDINIFSGFDALVLCLDTDNISATEKELEVKTEVERILQHPKYTYKSLPAGCRFEILTQEICIETWFLGNTNLLALPDEYETETLRQYLTHFDITTQNPEAMPLLESSRYSTNALFHEGYLREICAVLKERHRNSGFYGVSQIFYRKEKPNFITQNAHFLHHLQTRIAEKPLHLQSFQRFLAFCESVQ